MGCDDAASQIDFCEFVALPDAPCEMTLVLWMTFIRQRAERQADFAMMRSDKVCNEVALFPRQTRAWM